MAAPPAVPTGKGCGAELQRPASHVTAAGHVATGHAAHMNIGEADQQTFRGLFCGLIGLRCVTDRVRVFKQSEKYG